MFLLRTADKFRSHLTTTNIPTWLPASSTHVQWVPGKKEQLSMPLFLSMNDVDIFRVTESWSRSKGVQSEVQRPVTTWIHHCFTSSFITWRWRLHCHQRLTPKMSSHVSVKSEFPFPHSTLELMHLTIPLPQHTVSLFCLYRPPPNRKK